VNWQEAFNIAFSAAAFLGGYFVKTLWEAIKDVQAADRALTEKVAAIEVLVAGSYVTRTEYRDDLRNINTVLERIESKLDGKQDKESRR
jgi:hypothetical protein